MKRYLIEKIKSLYRLLFFILAILLVGYRNIAIPFWLLSPIILALCLAQDSKDIFYSDYFILFWIFGTLLFYVLYFKTIKYMNSKAESVLKDWTKKK